MATFQRGDHVYHRPTGESWVVKDASADHVWPCGWPPCRAAATDCEMIESAADRRAAGKYVLTDKYDWSA